MNALHIFAVMLCFIPNSNMKSTFVILQPPTCAEYNPSYLQDLCMVFHDNKINMDLNLIKPLQSGLRINMNFSARKRTTGAYSNFYQFSLDMCRMLAQPKQNIFKAWFSTFFTYGNFERVCPVKPSRYYLRNYRIYDLNVPSFLFTGFYRLKFNLIQSNGPTKEFVLGCQVEVEIK